MEDPSRNKGKEIAISDIPDAASPNRKPETPPPEPAHFEIKLRRVREMRLAVAALADPEFNLKGLARIDVDELDGFDVTVYNPGTETHGRLRFDSYNNTSLVCFDPVRERIVSLLDIAANLTAEDDEYGFSIRHNWGSNQLTFTISGECQPPRKYKDPDDIFRDVLQDVEEEVPIFHVEGCVPSDSSLAVPSSSTATNRPSRTFNVPFLENQAEIPEYPVTETFCKGTARFTDMHLVINSSPKIVSCGILNNRAALEVVTNEEYQMEKVEVIAASNQSDQARNGWFLWNHGKMLEPVYTLDTSFQVLLVRVPPKTIILRFPLVLDQAGVLEFLGKAESIYPTALHWRDRP